MGQVRPRAQVGQRETDGRSCGMRLFFRFIWPRSWQSLYVWMPLIAVGILACVGLSLAMGFRSGALAQHDAATLRDGPPGLQPRTQPVEGPLRSSEVVATGYGPLVITVFWGEEGQWLGLPGIPEVEASGTALASSAVLAQLTDDWTGELTGWLGEGPVRELPDDALAHPREMVVVEFTDAVPPDIAQRFHPIRAGRSWAPETGFVIVGLIILVLPSVALVRAGAAVHLNARSRRYGLLRVLGTPPRQLALAMAADMAIPMLAGALVGSIVYSVVMFSLGSFTLAGTSYWARDLVLPVALAIALPPVTVAVGLMSVARIVHQASSDPLGTLRRDRRRRVSRLSYLMAVGAIVGPAAMFTAPEADWLMPAGMLLSVVGLEGLTRIAVAVAGRILVDRTRAQISGSRMSHSGSVAVLGVSATSIAVLFIVFFVSSNLKNLPVPIGTFDVLARLPNLASSEPIVRAMSDIDGVTRVVAVGKIIVDSDQGIRHVYAMTCDDARGSVKLDAPCTTGSIYLGKGLPGMDTVTLAHDVGGPPGSVILSSSTDYTDESIPGTYPVGGRVDASWIAYGRAEVVLMVDQPPIPHHTLLLVTTDGSTRSLRRVMEGFRNRPEESYPITRDALTTGVDELALIIYPYMLVMSTTAAGMAAVALLYAVILLFRQRQAEFRMLRCQGATRMLLAVDLSLLFAIPLILSFSLAVASGMILAVSYNAAFGVPAPQVNPQVISVLAFVLAIGMAATVLVTGRAARIPPLITDPDATTD